MLDKPIIMLLKDNNKAAYGHLLSSCVKRADYNLPAPAAVSVTTQINLYYNPNMFFKFTLSEQAAILEHEVLHLVLSHATKGRYGNRDKKIWNYAVDIVVNQHIDGLPAGVITHDKFNLPPGLTADTYYTLLMEKADKVKVECESVDSHDKFEESTESDVIGRSIIRDAMVNAKTKAGPGKSTALMDTLINEYGKSVVDWKKKLREFFVNSVKVSKRSTRKRVNRRYGTMYAGKIANREAHVAICTDVSGSVSDESIKQYFAEINSIIKTNKVKITIIEADCEVSQVYEYKRGQPVTIKARGGTAYQPAINKALELDVDGIMYFGDGDSADSPSKPKVPFLWVMVQGGKPPADFGKVVNL